MYRMAAKRLLLLATSRGTIQAPVSRLPPREAIVAPRARFSTTVNSPPSGKYTGDQSVKLDPGKSNQSESASSSSSPFSSGKTEGPPRNEKQKPRVEFEEEQARVLRASLHHVPRLGWTEEAMIAGARDSGVSPSIVGSFSRKEAALVEFFMDDCLQRLIDRIDSGEGLQNMTPSQRISNLVRIRLEMQAPYISKWPQALSIQAHPLNVPTSFKQRAMLMDEIWHAVGDEASDIDWYVKRTILGGIYSTTEIYMLTDNSPEFRDTWAFLEDRVKDVFELKKTFQEAKYFAEDVGAGMGRSLRGVMSGVVQSLSRDRTTF